MVTGGLMGGGKYAGTQAINWVGSRHNNGTLALEGSDQYGQQEESGTQENDRGHSWRTIEGANRGSAEINARKTASVASTTEKQINPSWSSGTNQAAQVIYDSGGEFVVEPEEQIRAHVNGQAYTSGGVTHLSDKIDETLGVVIGNHERVHQLKQRENVNYAVFVDNTGSKIDPSSQQTEYILSLLSETRFFQPDFMELSSEQQQTVLDELNALVYGYYKDNAANAKSHFGEVFYDYDSYVAELGSIVNAASKSGSAAQGAQPLSTPPTFNSEVSPFADIKHSLSKSQEVQKLSSVAHTFQERQALDRYKNAVDLLENRQRVLTDTQNRLQQLASTGDTRSAAYTKLKSVELELKRKVSDAQHRVQSIEDGASVKALREKAKTSNTNNTRTLVDISESERYNISNNVRATIKSEAVTKILNLGAQNKHIRGTNEYIEGRSYLYIDLDIAQQIIDSCHGTGEIILNRKGEWAHKEVVMLDKVVGVSKNPIDGTESETRRVTIHYGKRGTHLVPTKENKNELQ